ncbi:hypothetical protein [Bosea sp. BH3]|uniref:hypothetical protein n=1 Tax=Bosea sp. BH3 TaxID=2871701 RepID=UPI0021CB93A1|nr:hypothetical protein [Bosea sp. BH3]MCU4178209.1 hypothetical protein [Bosea sp. BH3]
MVPRSRDGFADAARTMCRARVGPPLHLSVLRKNLEKFAHCDVFVEGLKKAGVPE